jgi:Ca-activated chloride channel homolog
MKTLFVVLVACCAQVALAVVPDDINVPAGAVQDDGTAGGALEAIVDGQPVTLPLLRSDMVAHIRGDLATVELIQRFENPHTTPLHARYIFPLPPDAAVYAMRLTAGDEVIEAEIRQKDVARQEFDAAKREGKQAALLTQHRPNVFTQEVANLMPGVTVMVEIRYAHPIPKHDWEYDFHFPMVVGPRYVPASRGAADEPEPLPLGQWCLPASPPVVAPEQADAQRASLYIDLDAGLPVVAIDSPSHTIDVQEISPTRRVVRLADEQTIGNKDFVLRYRLSGETVGVGSTTFADLRTGVVSLLIEPPAKTSAPDVTPREMVFVLDCSGSMSGTPLAVSKRFMRRALANLEPRDVFRIIRFSDAATSLTTAPLPATPENIAGGLAQIESLISEGGTEMTTGIRAALDPAPIPGTLRIVVFLTDGYIGNDADIVRLIAQRRGDARLFSFGIGTAVNRYLLREMARAGRGVARIVLPQEDAAHAADMLAERLAAPYLTDVDIDWGTAPVHDMTPAMLPDLFLGQSVRVLARFEVPGTHRITVHGKIAGRAVALPIDITLPKEDPAAHALPILWARSQVEDWMIDYLDPTRTASQRQQIQAAVTQLGLAHHLVTQWTAFVAVAKKIVNPGGQGIAADVPVPQVEGVSAAAYPAGTSFAGNTGPEPAEWAAVLSLMALATWWLRRRGDSVGASD